MRAFLFSLPLLLVATPALAEQPSKPGAPNAAPIVPAVPKELTDPATAEKLSSMMQALSKALLDLRVGELQAAAEGRAATAADKQRTIRDLGGQADIETALASSKVTIEASMKALAAALPSMMQGMASAAKELEKATANMPRPDYPKR